MRRVLVVAAVVLAGCATYQPKPLAPAQLAQGFEERSLVSDDVRTYIAQQLGHEVEPWPPPRWNREMLTLAAYYYSPTLAVARAQSGTANAGIAVAGAVPNPVLQLPFQYATNYPGPGRPYTVGPALDIPIETANKRDYRVEQATRLAEAAHLSVDNQTWQVRSQVRSALVSLYAARELVTLRSQQVAAQQEAEQMLRKRLAVGEASEPDVHETELALLQAQVDLSAAQAALRDARAVLAKAIGVPLAALDSIELDLADFEHTGTAPPSMEARRGAILHRADLLASLAAYEASQAGLQLEIAKQYPDIHLGPGYTYDLGTNKIGFGLAGITLPIFDQNQGGIAQAEAKRAEAAARTEALQDAIINDLERTLGAYSASLEALRLATERMSTEQQRFAAQAARFAAGDADRLSLTLARAAYLTTAVDRLNDLVSAQRAAGALQAAMQMPLWPDGVDTRSIARVPSQ
jgi:outer membrane protein TolC